LSSQLVTCRYDDDILVSVDVNAASKICKVSNISHSAQGYNCWKY